MIKRILITSISLFIFTHSIALYSQDEIYYKTVTGKGVVKTINSENKELIKSYTIEDKKKEESFLPTTIFLSPDQKHFAYLHNKLKEITLWDIELDKKLASHAIKTGYISPLTFTNDGNSIIFASTDLIVKIWDTKKGIVTDSLVGGAKGNWLWQSMSDGKFWRGDDGSLLSQSTIKQIPLVPKN